MSALFFFGSLKDPDLFRRVVGRPLQEFTTKPAILAGYSIYRAAKFPYPVVKADALGEAPGLLVTGFTATEIERVAYYETNEYDLYEVTIKVADGAFETAEAFFATEHLEISQEPWCFEEWTREAKDLALIEAEIAMTYFGVLTRETVNDHWPDFERKAAQILDERQRANASA